jgi:hypothetical protein
MAKKRTVKRATAKKRAGARTASKRRAKRSAKKAARGPLASMRVAGKKTWKALKSTTAHVVEGVKGTLGSETRSNGR